MSDLLAILHTPDSRESTKSALLNKFKCIIAHLNIGKVDIKVNPRLPVNNHLEGKSKELMTVIIGWGLRTRPTWETIIPEPKNLESVRQFIAIDLFERKGIDGRILKKPLINAGIFQGKRMQLNNLTHFLEGNCFQTSTPYGLKKVEVFGYDNNQDSTTLCTFELGESSEIEIVRMIFELFVDHEHNRAEICNLLNAQQVNAPKDFKAWTPGLVKSILKCPFYIGANKYREFIKYDVFTPIIEKTVYFAAQARIP